MPAEIIWSPTAEKSFDKLILFLESKWNEKVIEKLFTDLNKSLEAMSNRPEIFPVYSENKKLRKCVLRKKTLLLYRIKPNHIIELAIFVDSRQNPNKYKF